MDKPLSHDATSQPSAIYVWLVPSEQVLEQPGGWRIRKWDTAPFPEANFTLSPKEDVGPWRIVAESNGATLYSEDFEHDVAITIGGDFADTAQAIAYAENVAKRLSTLPSATERTPPTLLQDLRYEITRITLGAPADNARLIRLSERITEALK